MACPQKSARSSESVSHDGSLSSRRSERDHEEDKVDDIRVVHKHDIHLHKVSWVSVKLVVITKANENLELYTGLSSLSTVSLALSFKHRYTSVRDPSSIYLNIGTDIG